jgi:hypothetical protein
VSLIRGALPLIALACGFVAIAAIDPAMAAPCSFQQQGEGRVATVIDARSFRLSDGREIRLAGIEPVASEAANRTAALSAIVAGHYVTLHGEDDTPDRYGRQPAFVFLDGSGNSVQAILLEQGEARLRRRRRQGLRCGAACGRNRGAGGQTGNLGGSGRHKKRGKSGRYLGREWARFMLVEGRVLSVRQAGATTYLNFGRNWTRDFAVTISRRSLASFAAAGIAPKSLENRRIRVRGFIETRTGPRIEVLRVGQIELLGAN